jgi:hypothetical protein
MTEGRQPFTAEIKMLAKGPSTYDPLENEIRRFQTLLKRLKCAHSSHCPRVRSTDQVDPLLPLPISPVRAVNARKPP